MVNQVNTNLASPVASINDHRAGEPERKLTVSGHYKNASYPQVVIVLRDEAACEHVTDALQKADMKSLLDAGLEPKGTALDDANQRGRYDAVKLNISLPTKSMVNWNGQPHMSVQRKAGKLPPELVQVNAESILDVLHDAGIVDKSTFVPAQEISKGHGR